MLLTFFYMGKKRGVIRGSNFGSGNDKEWGGRGITFFERQTLFWGADSESGIHYVKFRHFARLAVFGSITGMSYFFLKV